MATVHYPAIIERGSKGFGVIFPDLPGCTSAGKTVQEAARNAEEALGGHLVAMAAYGDPIPEPSDFDAIAVDPDIKEAARLLVRAERPGKKVRINVMLDEGLVSAIDAVAENRSKFLSEAAMKVLRG
jgi:predicted RNase H-like HicB family nuclease